MKLHDLLLGFLLLALLCPMAQVACAQKPEKPKITASSNAQTTYKPVKKTVVDKKDGKTVAKTSMAKPGTPVKEGIKANPSEKQVQGKKENSAKVKGNRRYVVLKSNVPFQVLSMHNLAVEAQVHKHVTIDFPVMWSFSDIERKHAVRGIAFQPEGRWWLENAGEGHFFGIHAHAAWFNLKWKDNRYQTEKQPLLGAGISYGYKLPISSHWGVEFNVGAGYAKMKYNTYYNIENGAKLDKRIRNYWGITRAGISLVYRF